MIECKKIIKTIGYLPPESGGIIAFNDERDIVDFYFDRTEITYKVQYIPNVNAIKEYIL